MERSQEEVKKIVTSQEFLDWSQKVVEEVATTLEALVAVVAPTSFRFDEKISYALDDPDGEFTIVVTYKEWVRFIQYMIHRSMVQGIEEGKRILAGQVLSSVMEVLLKEDIEEMTEHLRREHGMDSDLN